jgi:hypothetical protein
MGPWVRLVPVLAGAGNWNLTANIFGTNRFHPCEFIPVLEFALAGTLVCPAGAHTLYQPDSYFSGPAKVAGSFDTVTPEIRVNGMSVGGVTYTHDDQGIFSSTPFSFNTVLPGGAWWLDVFNSASVAGTLVLVVTPSLTGST